MELAAWASFAVCFPPRQWRRGIRKCWCCAFGSHGGFPSWNRGIRRGSLCRLWRLGARCWPEDLDRMILRGVRGGVAPSFVWGIPKTGRLPLAAARGSVQPVKAPSVMARGKEVALWRPYLFVKTSHKLNIQRFETVTTRGDEIETNMNSCIVNMNRAVDAWLLV